MSRGGGRRTISGYYCFGAAAAMPVTSCTGLRLASSHRRWLSLAEDYGHPGTISRNVHPSGVEAWCSDPARQRI
jgi:hypothetical protein